MLYYTIFIYLILLAFYITIVCHRKTRGNPDVNFSNYRGFHKTKLRWTNVILRVMTRIQLMTIIIAMKSAPIGSANRQTCLPANKVETVSLHPDTCYNANSFSIKVFQFKYSKLMSKCIKSSIIMGKSLASTQPRPQSYSLNVNCQVVNNITYFNISPGLSGV